MMSNHKSIAICLRFLCVGVESGSLSQRSVHSIFME